MKRNHLIAIVVLVGLVLVGGRDAASLRADEPRNQGLPAPRATLGTAFTYQGQLKQGGAPITTSVDLQFGLWDADTLGSQVGVTKTVSTLPDRNGLFTVLLEFGNVFDGNGRWLDVAVKTTGDPGYTPLTPRQALTAVPYAIRAMTATDADTLDGLHSAAFAAAAHTHSGSDVTSEVANATNAKYFNGSLSGDVTGTQGATIVGKLQGRSISSATPASGQTLQFDGSQWLPANPATYSGGDGLTLIGNQFRVNFDGSGSATTAARGDHDHEGSYWNLRGNGGTVSTTNYLGTSDDQPLVVRTNGVEALRVDGTGKVGIGTITPTEKLTVRGNGLILGEDSPLAKGSTSENLGGPNSVFVSGKYAYVTSDISNTLAIFDVSNPNNIVAKGYTTTLNGPNSVFVSGKYAYVTSGISDSLTIFDVSNPNNIVAKGSTSDNLNDPRSVVVSGRYAYVASGGNSRLAIFDVSDPDRIVPQDYASTNLSGPSSVYVSGRYAYVASTGNSRLAIFDISDPTNIVPLDYDSTRLWGPKSVYVSGGYAYLTSIGSNPDMLTIFDVSDPTNIVPRGFAWTYLGNSTSVFVSGKYAYVSSSSKALAVFDVSDPGNIVARASIDPPSAGPRSVYVSGKHAYVASWGAGTLAVFEVNNLEAPTLQSGNSQTGYLDVTDNAIVGNNLYVKGGLNVGPGGALIDGELSVDSRLSLRADARSATSISIGDRYRDNGIIAWAKISATGGREAEYGVTSVVKSTGTYTITIDADAASPSSLIPVASAVVSSPPTSAAAARLVTVKQAATNQFVVYITTGEYVLVNNAFVFMVTGR